MKNFIPIAVALSALFAAHSVLAVDQDPREVVKQLILARDAEFWTAFNSCDTSQYDRYFARDVEFYHDRGGITLGVDAVRETTRRNLCSSPKPHLRREAVPDTTRVSILQNGEEIYGAILSGEHVFFVLEADKPPRLDGHARYVHLWLKRDGDFKMARILSFDHGPATPASSTSPLSLSAAVLDRYVGTFTSQKFGELSVTREGDHLALDVGGKHRAIFPSDETTFTMNDRDVSFHFVLTKGAPEKIIVKEHGELVDEALPALRKE